MKRLLLPFLLISVFLSFSQSTFHKSYDFGGDDYGNKVIGSTQGLFVTGSTSNSAGQGSYDLYMMRLDSLGQVQWQTQWGGSQFDAGRSLTPFQGMGFLVAGSTSSLSVSHKSDAVLNLLDSAGKYYGSAYYGYDSIDESFNDVITLKDSTMLVVGKTQSNTNGGRTNMLVMHLNREADVIWAKTYGSPNANSEGFRLFDIGEGFIAVGNTNSGGAGDLDGWIMNFDSLGNLVNQLVIGRQFYDEGRFFTVANNYIIFGGMAGRIGGQGSYIYLTALNPGNNLATVWSKGYARDTSSIGFLGSGPDGNLVVGGSRGVPGKGDDAIVFKVNPADGSVIWSKSFGNTGDEYIVDGTVLEDGSIVLSGITDETGGPTNNVMIARIGSDGTLCGSADISLVVADQTDSVTGPVIPDLRDSVVALIKMDAGFKDSFATVTVNDYCLNTPVRQVISKDNSIKLYPNPTSGSLIVESSTGWNTQVKMNVYDVLGSVVFTKTIEPNTKNFTIDLSGKAKGMYIITFNDGSSITTHKISLN